MRRALLILTLGVLLLAALPSRASAFLYWAGGGIERVGVNGGNARQLIRTEREPWAIATDAGQIYWTHFYRPETIGRASLDGSEVNEDFLSVAQKYRNEIAVDAGHIYWTHGDMIGRANIDGTEVNEDFMTLSDEPTGFAVEGSYIYWVNPRRDTIGRASLEGTEANQSFIETLEEPKGLAVGEGHIYWFNETGDYPLGMGRATIDGGEVEQEFITGLMGGSQIAVGSGYLFWNSAYIGSETSSIGRASVNGSHVEQEFIWTGYVDATHFAVSGNSFELEVSKTGSGAGAVTSSTPGIDCGPECGAELEEGEEVTLTPSAAAGSEFQGWSGACSGSGACTVTISAARSVGAQFSADPGYTRLSVNEQGNGTGTVTSSPAGIKCGPECEATLSEGGAVVLKAVPGPNSEAALWTGCERVNGADECEVTMSAAEEVTASFTLERHPLKIATSGPGTVASFPRGIECGSSCETVFNGGTKVTLRGVPYGPGTEEAVQWSGCNQVSLGRCEVTMSAAKEVTASFTEQHELTVAVSGSGTGTVSGVRSAIYCGSEGSECEAAVNVDTEVTLRGIPGPHSNFPEWSGCDEVVGADECKVTMRAAREVTASFSENTEQLPVKVAISGTGTGTVTSSPGGIECDGGECQADFQYRTEVTLKGTPGPHSEAVHWTACGAINGADECNVTTTEAREVAAEFNLEHLQLKVATSGSGTGTVTSSLAGIECGTECQASFEYGAQVTLKGAPGPHSAAAKWSGCDEIVGADECKVTMSAAREVTATFALEQHQLTVTKSGSGSGIVHSSPAGIDCGTKCQASFEYDSSVTLKGTSDPHTSEVRWSGCEGVNNANECVVTMSAAEEVTATFTLERRYLTVTKEGAGTGSVSSSPVGINCGATCSAEFDYGDLVTLKGAPGPNSKAARWSGCNSVHGADECNVMMSAIKEVKATFALEQHLLKVAVSGSGRGTVTSFPAGINCDPTCAANFDHGTVIILSGTPLPNSRAARWMGCGRVNGANGCEVTMSAAREVSATFDLLPRCRNGLRKKRIRGRERCVKVKRHKSKRR